uniref:Profilin n=1 Tax=Arion vulgaris TaxID=1028688 RepID=A0A0B6Z6J8_9EUPU
MLQLMTWSEIIENFKLEGDLKMAAIFDSNGEKIAGTDGVTITSSEAISIWKSLVTISNDVYSLFLMESKFSCFPVDNDTLIGQSKSDVIVARKSQNLLICAVSGLNSKKSCLATVKNFAGRLVEEGTPGVPVDSLI